MTHPIRYVTVKGNVSAFVPDGMDPDDDPDEVGVTGSVRFTLVLNNRDAVLMPHHPNGPTIRTVMPFDVPLDSNGDLSHRGKKFVKLPALDEWTNPQVARYRVEFVDLRVRGERVNLRPLEIPAVPDSVVDLANEFPVPGSPAPGVTRGPRGDSVAAARVEGSSLVFSLDTEPPSDLAPVPLPAIGELAEAADVAVAARDVAVAARDDVVDAAGIALASAEFADTRASAADASAQSAWTAAGQAADVVPQATASVFGKVKLKGDLGGTAETPTVPALASKADLVGGKVPAGQLPETTPADNTVGTSKLVNGAVTLAKLAANSVDGTKIADKAVTGPKLAASSVDNVKLTADAVYNANIANGAVDNAKIANNAAIAFSKLSGVPFEMIIVHSSNTRKTGYGDLLVGEPVPRACVIDSVLYQFGSADASGSTQVELRKNTTTITGTSLTVTAANQADGVATDAARTGTATAGNTFAQNDRLCVYVGSLGTTPGRVLKAVIRGRYT